MRDVLRLAGNLVDLVDVDDAEFGALDIVVADLQEPQEYVFDILADIARLRQRGRVRNAEGTLSMLRQRLRKKRLAAPVGPISRMLLFSSSTVSSGGMVMRR